MSGNPAYTYKPLTSGANFRLLRLELNSNSERLKSELCEYPLDQAPPYICLSYVWGVNREIRDVIDMQGGSLAVTNAVSMALRWIRGWKLDQGTLASVMVWIDYICINQDDRAERAEQVGHMKTLYSQAELVLVYLGPEDQGSDQIPELYGKIRLAYKHHYESLKNDVDGAISAEIRDLSLREMDGIGLASRGDPIWDAHRAFMRRPWFLRTWIIQEAVLARKLLFVCGSWGAEGNLLTDGWDIIVAQQLLHFVSNQTAKEATKQYAPESRAIHQILLMLNMGMGRVVKNSSSLIELLQMSRSAVATDPRDYVYGLLGLASDQYRAKVAVDYDEPVADTYRRVARIVVEVGEGAKLLYNIHGLETHLDLPSWVPDWSNQHFPFFSLSPIPGSASTTTDIPYVHAGGQQSEMRVSDDGNRLHCEGYIIDVIDRLTDPNIDDDEREDQADVTGRSDEDGEDPPSSSLSHSYQHLCRCLSEMAAFLEAKSAYSPEMHEETIWRNAIWNRPRSGQRKADMLYGALYKSFQNFIDFRSLGGQGVVEKSRTRMMALDKELDFLIPGDVAARIVLQEANNEQDQAEKFANWASTICIQMRRCGTTRGYLGHVPKIAQVGDVVCVIEGAAVPFNLRRTPEGYRVIGQCYLHGIMEGEALRDPSLEKEGITLV